MADDLDNALHFAFPVVKNGSGRLLSDDIVPFKPPTLEELAKGREIREWPQRYDHFRSMRDLKEYIRLQLHTKYRNCKASWLNVQVSQALPVNVYPGVYYTPAGRVHSIDYLEPAKNLLHDIRQGGTLVELDPQQWSVETLEAIVAELKAELTI